VSSRLFAFGCLRCDLTASGLSTHVCVSGCKKANARGTNGALLEEDDRGWLAVGKDLLGQLHEMYMPDHHSEATASAVSDRRRLSFMCTRGKLESNAT
jgi:hypothetical protein